MRNGGEAGRGQRRTRRGDDDRAAVARTSDRLAGDPAARLRRSSSGFAAARPQPSDLMAIMAEQRGGAPAPIFAHALSGRTSRSMARSTAFDKRARRHARRLSGRSCARGSRPAPVPVLQTFRPRRRMHRRSLTIRFADGETVREWLDVQHPRRDVGGRQPVAGGRSQVSIETRRCSSIAIGANNTRVRSPRLPLTAVRRLLNWLVWLQDTALTGTALV